MSIFLFMPVECSAVKVCASAKPAWSLKRTVLPAEELWHLIQWLQLRRNEWTFSIFSKRCLENFCMPPATVSESGSAR